MSHSRDQQRMEAVVIQASGPPAQSLAFRSEPVPEPGPGDALVEVHATGVNPFDVVTARDHGKHGNEPIERKQS